jgi:hypothetical protein
LTVIIKKEGNMRKDICLVTLGLLLCFVTLPAFAQGVTAKPKGQNEWELYGPDGGLFATVKKTEAGGLGFHDASGKYIGVIQTSGTWVPWNAKRRVTYIEADEAELYLQVLKVSKRLK